jgi:hypothetical protein
MVRAAVPQSAWDICIKLMEAGLLAKPTHETIIRCATLTLCLCARNCRSWVTEVVLSQYTDWQLMWLATLHTTARHRWFQCVPI